MSPKVVEILIQDGFITETDNLIDAEKAFFAARVVQWIRESVDSNPHFNLATYLTMLSYYKLGLADLKFSEDGARLLYRMRTGEEVDRVAKTITESSPEFFKDPHPEETN